MEKVLDIWPPANSRTEPKEASIWLLVLIILAYRWATLKKIKRAKSVSLYSETSERQIPRTQQRD